MQAVYDYLKSDFDQYTPVVTVGSEGMIGQASVDFSNNHPAYVYSVNLFVLDNPETDYTEEDIDDALDNVMQEIFETLETNRRVTGFWQFLEWTNPSTVQPVSMGGIAYLWEQIIVTVYVTQ